MTDDDIVKKSYWEWASADGSQQMRNEQAFTDRGIWGGATGKVCPSSCERVPAQRAKFSNYLERSMRPVSQKGERNG